MPDEAQINKILASDRLLCADIPLDVARYPLIQLLESFSCLAKTRTDVNLILSSRRLKSNTFSVWNFVEENALTDRVLFFPYYDVCRNFPIKKVKCALWINRHAHASEVTVDVLNAALEDSPQQKPKLALFFTSFHPEKHEGHSTLMRRWLDHLVSSGYRVHLVYYRLDRHQVADDMRRRSASKYDRYIEIPVESRLVGKNRTGLNVHADDWCGEEALRGVSNLCSEFEYDVAIVNYPFMSAVFEVIPSYTQKILLTHDSFANRNRRMLAEGYSSADWISISEEGERLAFARADTVVAVQGGEAQSFRRLCGGDADVRTVAPVLPIASESTTIREARAKLRVGYLGSSNWVNEENLALYLRAWLEIPELAERSEILIAGGFDRKLFCRLAPDGEKLLESARPKFLGRVDDLQTFFDRIDVFINPDRGGTGIKIKTLEALAAGAAVLATKAGAVGFGSASRYHNARDAAELAKLTLEAASDETLLEEARRQSREAYEQYYSRNCESMSELLGPPVENVGPALGRPSIASEKISVVVPFFNVEQYFEECLESILNQTHENLEIILVDDASLDSSRAVAERFARRDSRVKIVTHPSNRGLGPARNTGVSHATGDYILFLDSDDLFASAEAVALLLSEAQKSGCPVVAGACVRLLPDGSLEPADESDAKSKINGGGGVVQGLDCFLAGLWLPCSYYLPPRAWGLLIDRCFYVASTLDFPGGEHEDLPFTCFLYHLAERVRYVALPVVNYRVRQGSISTAPWTEERIGRYGELWKNFHRNLVRFGLSRYSGDAAAVLISHMLWRIQQNSKNEHHREVVADVIAEIFESVSAVQNPENFHQIMEQIRSFLGEMMRQPEYYQALTRCLPQGLLIDFYRKRAELPLVEAPYRVLETSGELQNTLDIQRAELSMALLTCEALSFRLEQAEAGAPKKKVAGRQVLAATERFCLGLPGGRGALALIEREFSKTLCTLGFRGVGEELWNHAAQLGKR